MTNFTPQQIEQFLQEFFDVVGTRQYVGARYVPIFGRAGESTVEWDDLAPYEPLTVVMHEGISYVSRRYVPRGIQITDTAYWAETYRFNAQVEQYRQEVLSFDSRISANTQAIADEAEVRAQAVEDEAAARAQAVADEATARAEADAAILTDVAETYVPFPDGTTWPRYGTPDQVMATLGNGETKWVDPVTVDADIAEPLIDAWLDDHPEATTTVEDNSITNAKLNLSVQGSVTANTDMNDYQKTGIYTLNLSNSQYDTIANAPSRSLTGGATALYLEVWHTSTTTNQGIIFQRFTCGWDGFANANGAVSRYGVESGGTMDWRAWAVEYLNEAGVVDRIRRSMYHGIIRANDDFNNFQERGTYSLTLSLNDYHTIAHRPDDWMIGYNPVGIFMDVYATSDTPDSGIVFQRLNCVGFSSANTAYSSVVRYGNYQNGTMTWFDWHVENLSDYGINNVFNVMMYRTDVRKNTDLNDYQGSGFYFINLGRTDYLTVLNAPSLDLVGEPVGMLMEVSHNHVSANNGMLIQRITPGYNTFSQRNGCVARYGVKQGSTFVWSDWTVEYLTASGVDARISELELPLTFHVGPNRSQTSILECVIAAERFKNSIVYVDPGTYDAVQEFKDLYGSGYFTNANYRSQTNFRGIPLTNGVHVIGYGGVTVTGGLQSTDQADAIEWWSIFNAGDDAGGTNGYGFTLENVTLEATNGYLRYLVHDEYGGTDFDYVNKYRNCRFVLPAGVDVSCIGGGLGKHGYIEIEGCTLTAPAYAATRRGINYHNNEDAGSLSEVYVKNCLIANGTVGITWYGSTPATEKSMLYVSNCTLQHEPIKQREVSAYDIENVDIVSWNNVIAGA